MLARCSIWLVILSTVLSAVPVLAAISPVERTEITAPMICAEVPPAPHATDDRQSHGASKHAAQTRGQLRNRWLSGWQKTLLMLAVMIPCIVLSLGGASVQGEDDWLTASSALFRSEGEHQADPPRYAAAPPHLPGCWLSGGRIPVAQIADYPRIPDLDRDGGLFDTWRPNLFGMDVPEEWDFQNLINTDRPDFTDATFSVGQGVALLETGYTFRSSNSDSIRLGRQQLPEALLRVGVTDEFELRIKWVGQVVTDIRDQSTGLSTTNTGSDDLQLGFKYELSQQEGWRPMFTFVGGAIVPSGTRGVSSNQVQPFANLVYGWGLRRWLYLKGSTGVDFAKTSDITQVVEGSLQEGPTALNSEDNISQWHQSFSLLFQVSPRIGGFAEWFSFFSNNGSDNRASHFLDTGAYIYVTPNVQLDVRIGTRVSDRVDTLFTGAGFSTRW